MLTTLNAVKVRLGIVDSDVRDDAVLVGYLELVSARFESQCNRRFGYAPNAAEEFHGDEAELRVSRYPMDASQPISFEYLERAADGWQSAGAVDYVVRAGCVISLASEIANARSQIRAT